MCEYETMKIRKYVRALVQSNVNLTEGGVRNHECCSG